MTPTSGHFIPALAYTPARRSMKDSVSPSSKAWPVERRWYVLPPRRCRKLWARQRCTSILITRKRWLASLFALFLTTRYGHLLSQKDIEICSASTGKKLPGKHWRSITRLYSCRYQERHTHEGRWHS